MQYTGFYLPTITPHLFVLSDKDGAYNRHYRAPTAAVMTRVGFEPTQLALADLKSAPLDHSGIWPEVLLPRIELGLTAHKTVVLTTIL